MTYTLGFNCIPKWYSSVEQKEDWFFHLFTKFLLKEGIYRSVMQHCSKRVIGEIHSHNYIPQNMVIGTIKCNIFGSGTDKIFSKPVIYYEVKWANFVRENIDLFPKELRNYIVSAYDNGIDFLNYQYKETIKEQYG